MMDHAEIVELADELAEIARTTSDAAAGLRLMKTVAWLFEKAGLPTPDQEAGGGEAPTRWLSDPVCCTA